MKGDDLIEALLRIKSGGSMLSMQLLAEVQRGYPARNLLRLIHSSSEWAASEGAWILAESGGHAAELLSELPSLVSHKNMRVRYWTVDIFLFVASTHDLKSTCAGFRLLEEPDSIVRSYAIRQFARFPSQVLIGICRATEMAPDHKSCGNLVKVMLATSEADILNGLDSAEVSLRSAAMSAAFRAGVLESTVLERALRSGDLALERIAEQERAQKLDHDQS